MKNLKITRQNAVHFFMPAFSVLTIILAFVYLSSLEGSLVPSPMEIFERFRQMLVTPISRATLQGHIWISLQRVLTALVFAVASGVFLGILLGWNQTFNSLVSPVLELLRPIPPIAWVPLSILWFGISETAMIYIVFVGAFFPILINTHSGMNTLDPLIINAGRIAGANKTQLLFYVAMPAVVPAILAGIKTSLSVGWMCVLAGEMIAARQGLGFLIIRGMEHADMAQIMVCMLVIGVVSALLSYSLTKLEGVLCPWMFNKAK